MDWNFEGNEYDPMIPNDYERVVRGKYNKGFQGFCFKYFCYYFLYYRQFNYYNKFILKCNYSLFLNIFSSL